MLVRLHAILYWFIYGGYSLTPADDSFNPWNAFESDGVSLLNLKQMEIFRGWCVDGWMEVWMGGWIYGWMDEWMDRLNSLHYIGLMNPYDWVWFNPFEILTNFFL